MSVSTMHIRCRKAGCGQLLAVWDGVAFVPYARIMFNDKGKASLICPSCQTPRRFARTDDLPSGRWSSPQGKADAA